MATATAVGGWSESPVAARSTPDGGDGFGGNG
jgi:hypothetical protein